MTWNVQIDSNGWKIANWEGSWKKTELTGINAWWRGRCVLDCSAMEGGGEGEGGRWEKEKREVEEENARRRMRRRRMKRGEMEKEEEGKKKIE
jgi:hypothetical protein